MKRYEWKRVSGKELQHNLIVAVIVAPIVLALFLFGFYVLTVLVNISKMFGG